MNWRMKTMMNCLRQETGLLLLLTTLMVLTGRSLAAELQAPRFITQPSASGSIVAVGRTKILQCQALGFPQPQYRWIKDGDFISGFSSEHFYKIQSVEREDAGSYQCIAKNSVGSILSEMIPLSVAFMTSFPENSGGRVKVKLGHAAVFTFPNITSEPSPSVSWQSEDNSLLYGTKYAVTRDNNLVILNVDGTDVKRYRARATNTQLGQEENSEYIELEVDTSQNIDVPPEIIVPPKNLTVTKDRSVTELQCIANARPLHLLSLVWLKDGTPIELSGIPYSFNDLWNRTLSLYSVDFVHDGVYTCQVKMRTGGPTLSASAHVTVLEKPHFKSKLPFETLGEIGKELLIPCNAGGSPEPKITWYRDSEPLENIGAVRYNIMENGSLLINYMRREDSGMFQCSAENSAGYSTGYTWLRVKTSVPILIQPPTNVTALDGKDATISCTAEGSPAPNITWYFNGGQISFSGRIQILEDGSLLIATVRSTDQGRYTCQRSNEAGNVEDSAWLKVLVRTQIIQPPSDTKVILGHVAKIYCKVSSDSGVGYDVVWYHEGVLIDDKSSHRINLDSDGTLQIAEARASDAGQYECEVQSSGGNDRRQARLDVIELPYAPTSVSALKINAGVEKAVNVSWTSGFDGNSPIIKHIVQLRYVPEEGPITENNLNWVTALANISSAKRWVVLKNLRSSAAYIFRVSSVNSVGEGPPSHHSQRVVLPQEPPSAPPLGFVGSARSESEIMIQWQPPAEEAQNGDILGFIVRYRLFGYHESPWSHRNISQPAQRNYLITELITWKDYQVQMAAYNRKGVGSYTEAVKIKTREGVPEAAPTNIRALATGSTTVKVWWLPPDPQKINGINQGYKLQAWRGDPELVSGPEKTVTVHPDVLAPLSEQTAVIEDLTAWTAYNVTVLCFTSPGDGVRSSGELVRTEQDFPGPVRDLKFEDITDRAVRVKWEAPESENGIILGYTVRYMVKDMLHTLQERNLTEDVTSYYVRSLKPTTHYTFEVYAWTEIGKGEASVATIQSGVEPVLPEPPTRLAVSNIEAFSAVLQFTPGFDGNSSITKWTVEALSARNASWTTIYEVVPSNPEATTLKVENLIPYMEYSLRLVANNVVGPSQPSLPTKKFQTIQAKPRHAPQNVTIRASEFTKLNVRWIPLSQQDWYGVPRGYNISYRILGDSTKLHSISIDNPAANSFVLTELEEFTLYEVILQAYNDIGTSDVSPTVKERTNEAIPGSGPKVVNATSTSSTTILVSWGPVDKQDENGLIEGYKVYYGGKSVPFQYKNIKSNTTMQTTLTELKKFTAYSIQVLAYTRIGDGALSSPPIQVTTFEDVPGPPSNVSFPDVEFTSARIIWDMPKEPNGEIKAYKVSYHLLSNDSKKFTEEFSADSRTYKAHKLDAMSYYLFSVTAKTALGWGYTAQGLVYTTNRRDAPQPPSGIQIFPSQIQDRDLTFSWTPGSDGYAPLRYYTVQFSENSGAWQTVPERVDPALTTYTVYNLRPFTEYRFRIQATNDIGPSGWSEESNSTQTLPAAPSARVSNLKVTPITRTDVSVTWEPLSASQFNGDTETGGYKIEYREVTDFPSPLTSSPQVELKGITIGEVVLNELIRDKNYEITVIAYNAQGLGPASRPKVVYVGEAVPTGAPRQIKAEPVSPTELRISWSPPEADSQNGDLLGYNIFYKADNEKEKRIEVASAPETSHSIIFLEMYMNYTISMSAFNPAGEGPESETVTARTLQGLPGPPANLSFSEITMNSLKVSWDRPIKPNGEILGYLVSYETAKQEENYSKQVKQRVSENFMYIHNLEERIPYNFSVKAQTIGDGPPAVGIVKTGPQQGSPERPRDLVLSKTLSSIRLSWINGKSGSGPILGYYIESRPKDLDEWKTEIRTGGGAVQDYTISYQNLSPLTTYYFRVIAYNQFGISEPCTNDETIKTPSKVYLDFGPQSLQVPFYRTVWFVVLLAAASIVIIIMVVAILCVKAKTYKYKEQAKEQVINDGSMEDGFSTFEMRQSRRGTMKSQRGTMKSTASRKSTNLAMINSSRAPPRPTPSMVNYSDEDSAKGYDENPDDSDSLTEKPSEISSTDSQGTESEQDSGGSDPHSFVNHYANVNNTFRKSWKQQKPAVSQAPPRPTIPTARGYSSFTESSDQDGNSAVVSLNGTQLVMNNQARSRAPLPGFSSFV